MKYNRTGFLQNDQFFSEPVEDIGYFLNIAKYIHFNPTNAGLEQMPGQSYPWSSYNEYLLSSPSLVDTNFLIETLGGIEAFQNFHSNSTCNQCLDIDRQHSRLPDDVAQEIVQKISNCSSITEFQKLSLLNRDEYISQMHQKGVSIRQLNRLTGTPRGVIQRIVAKNNYKS